jgi:hypothetical protein
MCRVIVIAAITVLGQDEISRDYEHKRNNGDVSDLD